MNKQISPQLHSLFDILRDDVIKISYTWQTIRNLFMNQEAVSLLNQTAPNFFLATQKAFADSLLLSITRITDPPQSRGRDNLVIARLLDHIDQSDHAATYSALKSLIDEAIIRSKPFRTHRNKTIGHTDLKLRTEPEELSLPRISVQDIEDTIKSLQTVINTFEQCFFDSETVFKIVERGGTKALITHLRKGLDTFELEKREALAGAKSHQ